MKAQETEFNGRVVLWEVRVMDELVCPYCGNDEPELIRESDGWEDGGGDFGESLERSAFCEVCQNDFVVETWDGSEL